MQRYQEDAFHTLNILGTPDLDDPTFKPISLEQLVRAKSALEVIFAELPGMIPNVSSASDPISDDVIISFPGASCRIEPEYTTVNLYSTKDHAFFCDYSLREPKNQELKLVNRMIEHLQKRARGEV